MGVMNLLITGGTGLIGQSLCNFLIKKGYQIFIISRRAQKYSQTSNRNPRYFSDFSEIHDKKIDVVINLSGETIAQRWTKSAKKRIFESRIVMTQKLVQYLQEQELRPAVFISASAVGYYGSGFSKTEWSESDYVSLDQHSFSQTLCHAWEEAASRVQSLGIRTVILRIGPVLSPSGGLIGQLKWSFLVGLGASIGHGEQFLSWIDLRDLIRLIDFAIENREMQGPINATAPCPVSYKEFAYHLARLYHRPCFFQIPGFFLKWILGDMAEELLIRGQYVLPHKALKFGFDFHYPSLEASLKTLFTEEAQVL